MERLPRSLLRRCCRGSRPDASAKTLIAYVSTVFVVSALTTGGVVSPNTLAASPAKVVGGRVWLLVTSGLTVDRPLAASLLSLVAFALVTTRVAGAKASLIAGAAGHVLSALVAYGVLEALQLGQPWQFAGELGRSDFGVSAVCAAWLGAGAGTLWLAYPSRVARSIVGTICLAVTAVAYRLHPGVSVIASEHVMSFGIGLLVVMPPLRRSLTAWVRRTIVEPWRRAGLDPVLGVLAAGIVVVVAIAVVPSALATVDSVAADRPASISLCISSWNHSWLAPRARVARSAPVFARVRRVPRIERSRTYHDCSITFFGGTRTISVRGRWTHGRVSAWDLDLLARAPVTQGNAAVAHADGVWLQRLDPLPRSLPPREHSLG